MSSTASGMISGPPSRAVPTPEKMRPSMSIETLIRAGSPMNRTVVPMRSIPRVPFEDLDDRMVFRDIEHLPGPLLAVAGG